MGALMSCGVPNDDGLLTADATCSDPEIGLGASNYWPEEPKN